MPKTLKGLLSVLVFCLLDTGVQAEVYWSVRPDDQLGDGERRGDFISGWARVIVDDTGAVQSLQDLKASYGSVLSALSTASANNAALVETTDIEDLGSVSRILTDPIHAVSGLLLLETYVGGLAANEDLKATKFILPRPDLLVFQAEFNSEIDTNFADLAFRLSQGSDGVSDLILTYAEGTYTTNAPPTAEEILMALGPDPENTLIITLKDGEVAIRLRDDLAPNHVSRLKELTRQNFYDGLVFHRVIDGFMAQTGDPTGTGTSGSGQNLNAEFTDAPFLRGTVGMARATSPNSADSQFFIMFDEGRFLDNNYTVIGQVTSGMEFVDQIKRGEPPTDPDKMIRVRVEADL